MKTLALAFAALLFSVLAVTAHPGHDDCPALDKSNCQKDGGR